MSVPEREHFLIQFSGPVKESQKEELKSEGVKLVSYIPENAWMASFRPGKADRVVGKDFIRYVGDLEARHKIISGLSQKMGDSAHVTVKVDFFPETSSSKAEDIIERHAEKVFRAGERSWSIDIESSEIEALASNDEVQWVSPVVSAQPSADLESSDSPDSDFSSGPDNNYAREEMKINPIQESPYNLRGQGLTLAEWDVGWAGEHSDLNYTGKLTRGDAGCSEDRCNVDDHATHVAGTMLGNGTIEPDERGMAPNASLLTYETPVMDSDQTDPTELYDETDDAINNHGALLSQNSWSFKPVGDNKCDDAERIYGNYHNWARYYDKIISDNSAEVDGILPVVFSAGNERQVCDPTYNTTTFPGLAKNIIQVGAVDWDKKMTSFSSWGPTDDGRIKPDVVGVGYKVRSTIPGNNYDYYSGTSMSAPAVSGTAALVSQQYNRSFGKFPAPATLKGLLIHNAQDLNRTGPDYTTGWGIVNGKNTVDYIKEAEDKDLVKTGKLSTDERDNYTVKVPEGRSVKVSLVWSDYPAAAGAQKTLVNDLDLEVWNNGQREYPWTLSWSDRKQPAERNKEDHTNNVEQVKIDSTDSRTLEISVDGYNVPEGPQNYSLLITEKTGQGLEPNVTFESPKNTTYLEAPVFNISSDEDIVSANLSVGGENRSLNNIENRGFTNSSIELPSDRYEAVFYAEDTDGDRASYSRYFTVDNEKPEISSTGLVENDNVSGTEEITASYSDRLSSISSATYRVENDSTQASGDIGTVLDTEKLADGSYDIIYNVSDSMGNYRVETWNFTIDNTRPTVNPVKPVKNKITGGFDVAATWSDNDAVEYSAFFFRNSSGAQLAGYLNESIDSNSYSDGKYSLNYNVTDYARNEASETVEIEIDNTPPDISVFSPEDGDYVSSSFNIDASVSDSYSGLQSLNYTIYNETYSSTEALNDTVDPSSLENGDYNVSFSAADHFNNTAEEQVGVTVDSSAPELEFISPEDGSVVTGNFSVNATVRDDVSGVKSSGFVLENSSGIQRNGKFNTSINSTYLEDGSYDLTVNATDSAGNTALEDREITIANRKIVIMSKTVTEGQNLSGQADINVTVDKPAALSRSRFRWSNESGNVTGWKDLNATGFETSSLADGDYSLDMWLNSSTGIVTTENVSGITVDNTAPQRSIEEYGEPVYRDWYLDGKTLEVGCTDATAGIEQVFVAAEDVNLSSASTPANFTLDETGTKQYSIGCRDFAGNENTTQRTYSIDSRSPEISSVSPNGGSGTDRSFTIDGEFNDESDESGINVSASQLQVSEGSIENIEWSNASFTADISGLEYSENFDVTGQVVDNVGHVHDIDLSYTVKRNPESDEDSESSDSSGGFSGGSGGFTASPDDEENSTENSTEEEYQNETESENETESSEASSCGNPVSAISPDENSCKKFDDSCKKPENWSKVESCSSWEEKKEVEQLIQNLSESQSVDKEILRRANASLEVGNYTRARKLASQARSDMEDRKENLIGYMVPFLLCLVLLTLFSYLIYRLYRRKRLEAEVEQISSEVVREVKSGEITEDQRFVESILAAGQAVEMGEYGKAREKLEEFRREAKGEKILQEV